MPYTTVAQVQALLGPNYDTINNPDLNQFIDSADILVAQIPQYAQWKKLYVLPSTTELEIIERWLSAHMYIMQDPTYRSRSTLAASGNFDGNTADFFNASRYGQQAMALDRSGYLRTLGQTEMRVAQVIQIGCV